MAGDRRGLRHGMLGVVAFIMVAVLGTRLWFLQVVDADDIRDRVETVRKREVDIPPERGRIFDTDGRILADNSRVLTVTVDQDVIRRRKDREILFGRLAGPLGTTQDALEQKYQNNPDSAVLPFAAATGVSEATATFLKERVEDYPGVDIRQDWNRLYPYAPLASQVVGYMGAIPADDPSTPVNELKQYLDAGYNRNERVGTSGIERYYETELRGTPGHAVYTVDAVGRVLSTVEYVPPVNGKDVQLTIDLDLQQFAEQALETSLRLRRLVTPYTKDTDPRHYSIHFPAPAGSIVVEEHGTGRIVAMASYPTFDNRWFSAGISSQKFAELFPDSSGLPPSQRPPSPLVNLAIQGRYNVGSTFKPFTAYAAVHHVLPLTGAPFIPNPLTDTYTDTGVYTIPEMFCKSAEGFKCTFKNAWNSVLDAPNRYGTLTLADALTVSSDAYFYRIGAEMFLEADRTPALQDEIKLFGFGEKSGIDLPFEYKGIVPDAAVKKKLAEQGAISADEGRGFYVGDSVQMAIGQGLNAVTPLQLTNAYATLANGGYLLRPQIVKAIFQPGVPNSPMAEVADVSKGIAEKTFDPVLRRVLEMRPDKVTPIYDGLKWVIAGKPGGPFINGHKPTAFFVFNNYPSMAQSLSGKTGTAQGYKSLAENDSSVFVAFQHDNPQGYTVGAYLEKAGYGADAAAPLVRCVFRALSGQVQVAAVEVSDELNTAAPVPAPVNLLDDPDCVKGPAQASTGER